MFPSNLPKALGGTVDVREGVGHSKKFAIGIWMATILLLAATVMVGYTIFSSLSKEALGIARPLSVEPSGLADRHADARRVLGGRPPGSPGHDRRLLIRVYAHAGLS